MEPKIPDDLAPRVNNYALDDEARQVSSAVRNSKDRGLLKCNEHFRMLQQWPLAHRQTELVDKAGFRYFRLIGPLALDFSLITALVERWRSETNTFHFSFGEMTITLKDVALILGLPIDGIGVVGQLSTRSTKSKYFCERFLGQSPEDLRGGMVRLSWLRETFSNCPENAPAEVIERHTRAYLLYVVGCTIFSTSRGTGNQVPVMYLSLFENFDKAGKYAWGAAALAFLYRELHKASCFRPQSTKEVADSPSRSNHSISGCLTLLQCWSYYYLAVGRPKLTEEQRGDLFPFVLKWKGKHIGTRQRPDLEFYRNALNSLDTSQIRWQPYKDMEGFVPEDVRNSLFLGLSVTVLICYDMAEKHLPDRCLRQFGMIQPVPNDVQSWERKVQEKDENIDLFEKMKWQLHEWSRRHLTTVKGGDCFNEVQPNACIVKGGNCSNEMEYNLSTANDGNGSSEMEYNLSTVNGGNFSNEMEYDFSIAKGGNCSNEMEYNLSIAKGGICSNEMECKILYPQIMMQNEGGSASLESEFRNMVAVLKEVDRIAQTFSTEGMDDHDKRLLVDIRDTLQRCLMDQVEVSAMNNCP